MEFDTLEDMSEGRSPPVVWGIRRAKTLETRVSEVAAVLDSLAEKAAPYSGPRDSLARDPDACSAALDTLREQHEELLVANEELRAQIEELGNLEEVVFFERARTEAIFLHAPDAYVITDSAGIIREVNLAAAHILNVPERFLVGKPLAAFVDRTEQERVRSMTTSASQGKVVEAPVRVRPRRAESTVATMTIVSAFDENAVLFWRFREARTTEPEPVPAHDELLTRERDARLQQERANDAKDRMIAVVSHDLRGPLNSILGWTEILRQSNNDETTRQKALAIIERSGHAQAALIEDLLDISRITTGKLKVQRSSLDLSTLVRRAVDTIRPTATAKHIELHVAGVERSFYVLGDAARLSQVLSNLLGNALKFTGSHGDVFVSIGTCEDDPSSVSVTVRDTGCGIKPEVLPTIFECFQQEEGHPPQGGLGLGLFISKQLVQLHNGTLQADSQGERRGALLTLKLPLQARVPHAAESKPRLDSVEDQKLAGLRVLVVDDDSDTRELSGIVLRQCGAHVMLASNARAAMQTFEVFAPNVVISDIRMEGVDGNDFIRALRKSKHAQVPAIAVSAESGDASIRRSIELGFDAYLVKPVEMRALVSAVAEAAEVGRIPAPSD